MQFGRAGRPVAQKGGVWDLPKWHQYHSTALMLLECTPRWYATNPWTRRHNWSRRLGEANWQKHVSVQLRMDDMRNGVEEEYMREDPARPSRRPMIPALGPSVPAQTQSHTSFIWSVCEREGQLRVPREPVEIGPGKSFRCYSCGKLLSSIRNRVDWKWVYFFGVISTNVIASGELILD